MKKEKQKKEKSQYIWAIKVTIITFFLSMCMNLATSEILERVNITTAFIVLLVVILIGIVFDIVGIAITSVSEAPFHARSAKGMKGGKEAISLIRSADKVSNFCNDVVGDIAGVISGGLAATIVVQITIDNPENSEFLSLILAGAVAALTVGGKAIGKGFALKKGDAIIAAVGRLIYNVKKISPKKRKDKNVNQSRKENKNAFRNNQFTKRS